MNEFLIFNKKEAIKIYGNERYYLDKQILNLPKKVLKDLEVLNEDLDKYGFIQQDIIIEFLSSLFYWSWGCNFCSCIVGI